MRKLTKALVLILCGLMLASMCACGDDDDPGGGKNEPVRETLRSAELKILFMSDNNPKDFQTVVTAVNDKLKMDGKPYSVKFEFASGNNYTTTVESKAKSGFDAAFIHIDNAAELIERGALKADLKPYLDMHGQAIYDDVPDSAFKQVTNHANGKIFAIPRHAPIANYREVMSVRGDWMAKHGISKITTLANSKAIFRL